MDALHPFRGPGGAKSVCRMRVFEPDDPLDAFVVVCSELPENPGASVTDAAEQLAAEAIGSYGLEGPV